MILDVFLCASSFIGNTSQDSPGKNVQLSLPLPPPPKGTILGVTWESQPATGAMPDSKCRLLSLGSKWQDCKNVLVFSEEVRVRRSGLSACLAKRMSDQGKVSPEWKVMGWIEKI